MFKTRYDDFVEYSWNFANFFPMEKKLGKNSEKTKIQKFFPMEKNNAVNKVFVQLFQWNRPRSDYGFLVISVNILSSRFSISWKTVNFSKIDVKMAKNWPKNGQ